MLSPDMHEHTDHASGSMAGHNHNDMISDFKKRFWVVLVLTVPIMMLSPMIQHWLGLHLSFKGSSYVLFALSTVVFL
ncbi:hypothetical protein ABTK92_20910, partial [Acinetobacter baumannii]